MIADQTPARKRRRYRDADERIFNLLNQFNGNASMPPQITLEFLRGAAHNFCIIICTYLQHAFFAINSFTLIPVCNVFEIK